ncbi:MAG: hypothetical protein DWG80_07580, partial [Chloroflexi bacterium]|nr:hypothetical protein [Chloroflexota bacterium]MQC18919.1 hypothetical protein [Chloroflexota bacterium]
MAGSGQSKASHRRERESREHVTQDRVTLIAIGVLIAVAIITAAGVIWGVILPPRAHVLTVGETTFTARDVEQRATFLIAGGTQSEDDPVDTAVNMLRREEILLQAGAPEVGEITADDMKQALKKNMAIAEDASDETFATSYAAFLESAYIDKEPWERMVRARVVVERLAKKFEAEVGTAGTQFHLMGVGSRERGKIVQLRDAVAAGGDFRAKATELGLVTPQQTPDFGWILPPSAGHLKDTVKVDQLQAGQMSEIVERNFQFELYFMAERDERREYTEQQLGSLSNVKVDDWAKQQVDQGKVTVTEDISADERRWILKQVTGKA